MSAAIRVRSCSSPVRTWAVIRARFCQRTNPAAHPPPATSAASAAEPSTANSRELPVAASPIVPVPTAVASTAAATATPASPRRRTHLRGCAPSTKKTPR